MYLTKNMLNNFFKNYDKNNFFVNIRSSTKKKTFYVTNLKNMN